MTPKKTTFRWWLITVVPVFVLLTVLFSFQTLLSDSTASPRPQPLKPEWYILDTARGEIRDNNSIVGNCFICHAFWVPIPRSTQNSSPRFAHSDVTLDHGSNDRCYNCHMIPDRNKYVADDGSGIPPQTPEQLCKRCHGLIFNDWQSGTHGKWTGSWLPEKLGDQITYTCTECHDPHSPAFRYTLIAPPPVWPDRYIRTPAEGTHSGPLTNFLVGDAPEEIF